MFDLSGKVAVVTGAGRGIGHGVALALARAGADVLAADLDGAAAEDTVRAVAALGRRSLAVRADVRAEGDMEAMAEAAVRDLGGLGVCVANAGIARLGSVLTMGRAEWDDLLAVNLTGVFLTVQACARAMVRQNRGGRVIVVASLAAERPTADLFAYAATKAGVRMMARCWAQELAPYDITVNSIGPGWVDTPMTADPIGQGEARAAFERAIPAGRVGTPTDVGHLACWLASDEAAYVTGGYHVVDGGLGDRDDAVLGSDGVAARNVEIRTRRATLSGEELLAAVDRAAEPPPAKG